MTWYDILVIVIFSALITLASLWLDEHILKDINTCPKCGHVKGEETK